MMIVRIKCLAFALLCTGGLTCAQDWNGVSVPADAGEGKVWDLQGNASDDFNYTYDAANAKTNFGNGKWFNFYHNGWDGPGTTYWKYDKVSVDGSDLIINAARWTRSGESAPITNNPNKMNKPDAGIATGCITSNNRVKYPVFVEAKVSVANITLASDVWLLSSSDKQEIDIIECYGGAQNGNDYFAKFIHMSHHSFVRTPFQDYQPRDRRSWWEKSGVTSWGEYCWNTGNRKYVRVGVNWISPFHFEYYVDGELVRVLYDKAFAYKVGNTWYYTYPSMKDGQLEMENGYQKVTQHATSSTYDFSKLQAASNVSTTSVIDPYNYQNGNGFTEELDIIINVESQDWHVAAGRTPTDSELANPAMNTMKVDWIRTYKPVDVTSGVEDLESAGIRVFPNPVKDSMTIQSEKPILKWELCGMNDAVLQSNELNGTTEVFSTSELAKGFYILKIQFANGNWGTKKIIKS